MVDVRASPTTWIIETVDASNNVGYSSSIAIDSDDFPHIAYHDMHWWDLKYATPSRVPGPDWAIMALDTVGDVGWSPSIALDSSGYPHISYHSAHTQSYNLKYVKWNGSAYATETIESSLLLYSGSSLVLDSNDNPRISYASNLANDDLKYAGWDGAHAVWFIETVDSIGSVGHGSSLALDSNGNPHISYLNFSGFVAYLKYAYWAGTEWSIETIDGPNHIMGATSLALDSNDNPHISYFDEAVKDLKYVHWDGRAWVDETVDAGADVGRFTCLALDWLDRPHIAYYDNHWDNLKYARWDGETWIIEVVDHVGDVGARPALALDSEGKPHISYYDWSNGNLKYASNPNEYFASVNITPFDSDSDGQEDSIRIQMDVDTKDVHGAYSGTVPIRVNAFLVDSFGYHADYNSSSWKITGQVVDWMHPNASVTLQVPPGYAEGPAMYSVEINLFDDDNFYEDFHHATNIELYPANAPPIPMIESCNSMGDHKDVFNLGETVYVTGSGFSPLTSYPFYIIADQEIWTDGMTIPERVPNTEPSIPSNEDGNIDPTDMWHNPQTVGNYDIIVDINRNGQYDEDVDVVDNSDMEVAYGLSIIPELPTMISLFTLMALSSIILLTRSARNSRKFKTT